MTGSASGPLAGCLMGSHVSQIDDLFDRGTLLQNICWALEANEHWANGRHIRQVDQQLVGDVGRVKVGKNQDVGIAIKFAKWKLALAKIFIQRNIGLHLAVNTKVRMALLKDVRRPCDLVDMLVARRPKTGKTQHG